MSEPLAHVQSPISEDDGVISLRGPFRTGTWKFNEGESDGWLKLNVLSIG